MKIYFAAAISAGRKYAPVYREIVNRLKELGHVVLTEHVADPEVLDRESNFLPEEVYTRDVEKLREADLLIAEVSHPSTGVGYEIAYTLGLGKPAICLYLKGLEMSKMITGNTEKRCRVFAYESINELLDHLPVWIQEATEGI